MSSSVHTDLIEIDNPEFPIFILEDEDSIVLAFSSIQYDEEGRIEVQLISIDKSLFLKIGLSNLVLISDGFLKLLREKDVIKLAIVPEVRSKEGELKTGFYGKVLDVRIPFSQENLDEIENVLNGNYGSIRVEEDMYFRLKQELVLKGINEDEAEEIARKVFHL